MKKIDANEFVAWLITQPNARGTLYLERVARFYVRYLKTAPSKLDLPLTTVQRNVFSCTKLHEFTSLYNAFLAAPNFKEVDFASSHHSFSAGLKCYKRYLEYLSQNDTDSNGEQEEYMIAMKDKTAGMLGHAEHPNVAPLFVDFSDPYGYANTRPVRCIISREIITASSWASMFVRVCERLLIVRKKNITAIKLKIKNKGTVPLVMDNPLAGLNCKKLYDGKWLNVNYSAPTLVRLIGMVCDACGISKETIKLTYTYDKPSVAKPTVVCKTEADKFDFDAEETDNAISLILSKMFSNGFRLGSVIELKRLRKFVNELLNKEISLDDDALTKLVKSCGTVFEGKVYVVSAETIEKIKHLVNDYFNGGAKVIFYEEFYAKNESWLFEASVVSGEMLKGIFSSTFPLLNFTQTYFGYTDVSVFNALESEILRVWDDNILLTYDKLAERLQYIPFNRIKYALGQNADFIWNSTGEFTHISKVDITEDEAFEIRCFAEKEICTHKYVSTTDIPISEISERNCELSVTAVHNAMFHICLWDEYEQHGKIITRKGYGIDAKHIMEDYCKTLDWCTLDDLLEFEKDLTGQCHRWIPMTAGYAVLIRTNENTFVSEKYIDFDTGAIDNAVEQFMNGGEYIPLRAVTTFALFPHCGQPWNLFLLESYCRRFSDNFRFEFLAVNSTNAGVITRKHSHLTYGDIMADAVAKSGINLDEKTVLTFLAESGFTSHRRYAKIAELIKQAKVLRA